MESCNSQKCEFPTANPYRFALEEVSYYFPPKVLWRSFFTAAVAAVTLKALNPHGTGKLVLLETTFSTEWQMKDIPIFVFIGIFGGLYGAIFNNLNMLWSRSFRKLRLISEHPVLEVVMICLLTSLICCKQFSARLVYCQ